MPTLTMVLMAVLVGAFANNIGQAQRGDVNEHLDAVARGLPSNSLLRREILSGARGSGVHFSWMDVMRRIAIKRVVARVDITFDRNGRPKHATVSRVEYFSQYDGEPAVSDSARLKAIRDSGLEGQVESVALERAAQGHWVDVPRPAPKPFIGGVRVELFDDEWLPAPPLIYFATPRNDSAVH